MTTSQENADAAALKELKIPFERAAGRRGAAGDSASEGKLQPGDVLMSINGKPITTSRDPG